MKISIRYDIAETRVTSVDTDDIAEWVARQQGQSFEQYEPFPARWEGDTDEAYREIVERWVRNNPHIVHAPIGDTEFDVEEREDDGVTIRRVDISRAR